MTCWDFLFCFSFLKPAEPVVLLQQTRDLVFRSGIHGHRQRVRLHSHKQSLLLRANWMVSDQVSASVLPTETTSMGVFGFSRPRAVQCRWFDCVFICVASLSFINGVLGLDDPSVFIPPPFCEDAKLEAEEPVHFYNLF